MVKRVILTLLFITNIANADIFDKGKTSFGLTAGASGSYFLLGGNINYFAMDNLNIGLMYRTWMGSSPTQNEFSLSANYFLKFNEKFRPYLGVFAKTRLISNYNDINSFGARGGLSFISGNTFTSVGYAYEKYGDCSTILQDCSTAYPEVVFGISF